jgi:hypothetical protein
MKCMFEKSVFPASSLKFAQQIVNIFPRAGIGALAIAGAASQEYVAEPAAGSLPVRNRTSGDAPWP